MLGSQAKNRMIETMAKEPSPSQLNTANYGNFLKVSKDKLSVQYIGKGSHSNDVGAIQADSPVPSDVLVYYYEVHVRDAGERGVIAVGFADFHFRLSRQPGWEPNSYGYHADDGNKFHNSGKGEEYGPSFVQGDTVGAGIHLENRDIFFTKNGKKLGVAFSNVKATLFPTVGLHSQNEHVEVNFGAKPFQFDIEGMIAEEREQRQFAVLQSEIPANACHNIVCSYLKHYGYADTLKAFDEDSFKDQLRSNEENLQAFSLEDRKRVRNMLFEGNIEGARQLLIGRQPQLAHSQTETPFLDAFFHLSVQQFIELLRQEKISEAVEHARTSFSTFQGHSDQIDQHLEDVLALLAYKDPYTSPMGYLMTTTQREAVADAINSAMLEASSNVPTPYASSGGSKTSKSVLEKILVQLCRVQAEIRRKNENKGEIFNLEDHIA
ncbi:SPRY domain-containing protein [Chloropicon primus]|uniref:SPRY domain-containing protein n=1 Tax=Chloropicon primus TaxID=1764295 RepID=A0A5B8MLM0_9CHLO|nr:SPRY domain-containing protein [Chloropicon primus]UPR00425.1 SPRY domain-containing protein [Chloropicon primus]|mmetsp:Transcript_3620/g.10256  ORF Transcript_3620/g.10256 Transcript_3620/m.10256 type:complete len:436 (+) Transcript_3620:254-1561(+)|eukprot:QDZ21211.1 SPRY domain-containing protein [Chloropicon primus]